MQFYFRIIESSELGRGLNLDLSLCNISASNIVVVSIDVRGSRPNTRYMLAVPRRY